MMKTSFKDLLTSGPKKLRPYVPGKNAKDFAGQIKVPDDLICKLSSNENPLGPSPRVKQAINDNLDKIFFYPDPDACELKEALSKHYKISKEQIALGNGSDELITQLTRLYASQTRPVLFTRNSFPAYKIAATACDVAFDEVDDLDYNTNLAALQAKALDKDYAIIWIANPNNPSGAWLDNQAITNFLEAIPRRTLVVLDEAYYEYTNDIPEFVDGLSLLEKHPNLILLRTFSKAYGLAGLRIGYSLSHPEITSSINTIRLPFNVNMFAQVAAIAALADKAHLLTVQSTNQEAREMFYNTLKALNLKPIKSASNSLMFDAGERAEALNQRLIEQGIIARMLTPFGLPSFIRVNTGTIAQNDYFITTLCQIVKEL